MIFGTSGLRFEELGRQFAPGEVGPDVLLGWLEDENTLIDSFIILQTVRTLFFRPTKQQFSVQTSKVKLVNVWVGLAHQGSDMTRLSDS